MSTIDHRRRQAGFTLLELLIVMGILAALIGVSSIGLLRPQADASLAGAASTIVADIRNQQLKAMSGDGGIEAVAEPLGVFFQSNGYTIFKDAAYAAANPENFFIANDPGITVTTTFPSSQLIFSKGSGDVSGFVAGSNTITIKNSANQTKVLTINRYGAVTET